MVSGTICRSEHTSSRSSIRVLSSCSRGLHEDRQEQAKRKCPEYQSTSLIILPFRSIHHVMGSFFFLFAFSSYEHNRNHHYTEARSLTDKRQRPQNSDIARTIVNQRLIAIFYFRIMSNFTKNFVVWCCNSRGFVL